MALRDHRVELWNQIVMLHFEQVPPCSYCFLYGTIPIAILRAPIRYLGPRFNVSRFPARGQRGYYISSKFRCVRENDCLIAFDLRAEKPGGALDQSRHGAAAPIEDTELTARSWRCCGD